MEVEIDPKGKKTHRYTLDVAGEVSAAIEFHPNGKQTQRFFFNDHTGSGSLLTDEKGNTVEEVHYEPFGVPLDAAGNIKWEGWEEQTSLFIGAELDATTHLYLTGPRTYDPVTGRFLQPDPIVGNVTHSDSLNPYAYSFNNPVAFADPSGYSAISKIFGFISSIIATVVTLNPAIGVAVGASVTGLIEGIEAGDGAGAVGSMIGGALQVATGMGYISADVSNAITMAYQLATNRGANALMGIAQTLLGYAIADSFSTPMGSYNAEPGISSADEQIGIRSVLEDDAEYREGRAQATRDVV
jgi:RHS repeat-associated protein